MMSIGKVVQLCSMDPMDPSWIHFRCSMDMSNGFPMDPLNIVSITQNSEEMGQMEIFLTKWLVPYSKWETGSHGMNLAVYWPFLNVGQKDRYTNRQFYPALGLNQRNNKKRCKICAVKLVMNVIFSQIETMVKNVYNIWIRINKLSKRSKMYATTILEAQETLNHWNILKHK